MIRLTPESETRPPKRARRDPRWGRLVLFLLPLMLVAALMAERWRGQRALAVWQRDMGDRGEVFDVAPLWPPASAADAEFVGDLAQAVGMLPPRLYDYANGLSGLVPDAPGTARRGSQEPQPHLEDTRNTTNSWQDLHALVREGEAGFQSLRRLLRTPASSQGYGIVKQLESGSIPSFVKLRHAAQALQAAVVNDLHRGDLANALENLEALSAFTRLYAKDPLLVSYMMRIAILGLSDDVYWDALQADGWSDAQLARLHQACECDPLLSEMPRVLAADRAGRLSDVQWFGSHSYNAWLRRYEGIYESFGQKPPASDTSPAALFWRQWVFHPVWCFAWADQEKLHYLQSVQGDMEALREGVQTRSWLSLTALMKRNHQDYRPPVAAWRFYLTLPVVDGFSRIVGDRAEAAPVYPYPQYERAWWVAMRRLTQHEMVKAVIAMKRYRLRHGQWPPSLAALTPEFLPAAPRDFMDGQELRYRLKPDGSFALYSVATDGEDQGGDPSPVPPDQYLRDGSEWGGRDWVWPQLAGKTTSK